MIKRLLLIPPSLIVISGMGLTGCAHDYAASRNFGQSVSAAIAQQTVNPKGAGRDGVSPGLDGTASKAAIDRYHKSFEQPQSLGNVMTLGVGGGTTR